MSGVWWVCKSCANESYDSRTAFQHTNDARHGGHALVTVECPPGTGSSDQGRKRARALYEQARREARADAIAAPEEGSA